MTALPPECTPFLDELPELALGILTGRARAETLADVEICPSCAEELERLSRAADALLEAVPAAEPPLGFEVRVLDRLGLQPRRRPFIRRRVALGLSGALVGVLGAFAIGFFLAPHPVSGPGGTRGLGVVESAQVVGASKSVGVAVAYAGQPAWLTISVTGLDVRGEVACWGRTRAGKAIELGQFWLGSGSGVWSMRLPTATSNLAEAYLTAPGGAVVGEATFGT